MNATEDPLICPVADDCGGCAWIGEPYAEQLERKTDLVRRTLAERPVLASIPVEPCLPAPQREAYRNRAKLAVRALGRRVVAGLHRRGTHHIVSLAPCRVQSGPIQQAMGFLVGWLARHRLARPDGPVFYVDLREAAGGRCHLTLVVDADAPDPPRALLERLIAEEDRWVGIALNRGQPGSSFPLGPESLTVAGEDGFVAPLPGAEGTSGQPVGLAVPPGGFFQVGPAALEPVHRRMAEHLGDEGALVDLYCGVGVHGLRLLALRPAGRGVELYGVESAPDLVRFARRNAERAGIEAEYREGAVERLLGALLDDSGATRAILNPGRSGCRPEALEAVASGSIQRLAYLSCNPASLARDLERLARCGLRARGVQPVDFMPQTDHVESLALLERTG